MQILTMSPSSVSCETQVFEAAGPDVRVVVELNDMTYGNQYEILVDHMHDSFAAGVPLLSQPNNNSTRCRSLSSRLLITRSNSKHNNDSDGGKGDGGKNKYKDGLKKDSAMPPLTTSRSGRHHGEAAAPSPRAVRTAEDITSTMVAGDHGTTADSSNKRRDRGKSKTSECAGSARQQPHHQQRQQQKSSSIDKHWTGVGFAFLSNLSVRRQQPRNKGSANSSGKESSIGDQRQMEPRNTSGGHTAAAAELEAKLQGAAVGRRRGMHWSLSKGFASGAVVPNNLPETLLCQASRSTMESPEEAAVYCIMSYPQPPSPPSPPCWRRLY